MEILWIFFFKGISFSNGKLHLSVLKKGNKYLYIPASSGPQTHTTNNFILAELRRYVCFNTTERNFTTIKCIFFLLGCAIVDM